MTITTTPLRDLAFAIQLTRIQHVLSYQTFPIALPNPEASNMVRDLGKGRSARSGRQLHRTNRRERTAARLWDS